MRKHFVSVIIPVRQINDYLRAETIPAILKQTYQDFEIIILPVLAAVLQVVLIILLHQSLMQIIGVSIIVSFFLFCALLLYYMINIY